MRDHHCSATATKCDCRRRPPHGEKAIFIHFLVLAQHQLPDSVLEILGPPCCDFILRCRSQKGPNCC